MSPRRIVAILISWGAAVLVLAGLFSYWIDSNDRQQRIELCNLVAVLRGGPPPVEGPAGDRAREIQVSLTRFSAICEEA